MKSSSSSFREVLLRPICLQENFYSKKMKQWIATIENANKSEASVLSKVNKLKVPSSISAIQKAERNSVMSENIYNLVKGF